MLVAPVATNQIYLPTPYPAQLGEVITSKEMDDPQGEQEVARLSLHIHARRRLLAKANRQAVRALTHRALSGQLRLTTNPSECDRFLPHCK